MRKWIAALLLSVLVLCTLPIPAKADQNIIDVNAVCSLNLKYMDADQPLDGVQFLLYRVADVDGNGNFSWTHTFAQYHLNPDPKQALTLSQTLAAYAARDGLSPTMIGVTDANGVASFTGMTTGMYLVMGESYTSGGNRITPVPTLAFFPFTGSDGRWNYDAELEVKYERATLENISLKVLKVWDDNHSSDRPDYIDVQLICDNMVYDEVRLNDQNNWRFVWDDLEKGHYWAVIEKEVPDGYYSSVDIEGITFVITNKAEEIPEEPPVTPPSDNPEPEIPTPPDKKPDIPVNDDPVIQKPETPQPEVPQPDNPKPETPEPEKPEIVNEEPNLPQTGMDWNPVIILASAGIGCMALGLVLRKKSSKN